MMAKKVFPDEKVGAFYNKNFINVKLQLDSTAKDDEEVKQWYADAQQISSDAKVATYPTYLFFNPDGKIVDRAVGYLEADQFIGAGQNALNPNLQYSKLVEQYRANPNDKTIIEALVTKAGDAHDEPLASELAAKYLTYDKALTAEQVKFLLDYTRSSSHKGFNLAMEHGEDIDAIAGKGAADNLINSVLFMEEIYPYFMKNAQNPTQMNWDKLQQSLQQKYPKVNLNGLILTTKAQTITMVKEPAKKLEMMNELEKQYKSVTSAKEWAEILNGLAWNAAESSDDKLLLTNALRQSKEAVDIKGINDTSIAMFSDTYAVILYKLGQKKEAIAVETRALELVKKAGGDSSSFNTTLDKMKKGVKNLFKD
jgi:thiol-disulfide isomerase/thioredoxin